MLYEVHKHYRHNIVYQKTFSDLNNALEYCLEDSTLCKDNGHALSIRKNHLESIFEINYYGNIEINISHTATEDELITLGIISK